MAAVFLYCKTTIAYLLFRSSPVLLVPHLFAWLGKAPSRGDTAAAALHPCQTDRPRRPPAPIPVQSFAAPAPIVASTSKVLPLTAKRLEVRLALPRSPDDTHTKCACAHASYLPLPPPLLEPALWRGLDRLHYRALSRDVGLPLQHDCPRVLGACRKVRQEARPQFLRTSMDSCSSTCHTRAPIKAHLPASELCQGRRGRRQEPGRQVGACRRGCARVCPRNATASHTHPSPRPSLSTPGTT